MRLAVEHPFIGFEGGGGTATLRRARRLASRSRHEAQSSRRPLAIAITIGVHAAVAAALWHATGRPSVVQPPQRIEVALVAPPERVVPPPPPPPVQRRLPQRERASVPAATPVPKLDAMPIDVPRIAAPQPLAILRAAVVTPLESPAGAVPAEHPSPAGSPPLPTPSVEPSLLPPRFDAAYLDNPPPTYPPAARRAREQGRVLLRVLVSAQGRAIDVVIAKSSGSALLDAAAIDAVRRWRFVPARRGDVAVQADVQVPIVFSLTR
jgi:protein TonB